MNHLRQNRFAEFKGKRTTCHRFMNIFSGIRNLVSCIILFLLLFIFWGSASAEQFPDAATNTTGPTDSTQEQIHPVLYPVKFFRKYISPADGNRCPMYPSCSKYCLEASQKHGLLMGWIMSCDRLVRCGRDELKRSPTVLVNDAKLSYDPLINNDFWW